MRLVQKLSAALILGTTAMLAASGYVRATREIGLLRATRVRDHDLIGRALAGAAAAVWRSEGEPAAMQLIGAANSGESKVHLRWVWLEGSGPASRLHVDPARLAALAPGATTTSIAPDDRGDSERYTYALVRVKDRLGAIELSETLDGERARAREILIDTARTTLLLAAVMALLSYLLGSWLVGRPVRALVDKARRTGRGDFGGPVDLRGRDELAELGREMNATSDALVVAGLAVTRETTARIAALEQVRHADRLSTVGKLASGVAHELGTPLNVIVARAEMIALQEATEAEARDYARIVVEQARKMTRIIRQLLEFARRRGPHKESHDVAAVAGHALSLLAPLAAQRGVSLAIEDAGGPHLTRLDAGQIEQALTNLVINAVHASASGGSIAVRVTRERALPPADVGGPEGTFVVVRVVDHGSGITAESLPHVFEPFFTTKDVGAGTGLGLSVTHGIAQDHGGWIHVESATGQGSTFALFLPLEPA